MKRRQNLSNKFENRDMETQCVYIGDVFCKIGRGKKYHVFPEDDLSYSYCSCGPAKSGTSKKIVRIKNVCLNCHREVLKEVIAK